ncbi:hypothetical protein AB0387_06195 [Streptomyces sp. NPDC089173]|uniref:hypothetical protein n=1 Tax=Streptomyces sp. NPDC089173 TaxID=3154965 RepID=UPI00344EFB83
MADDAMVVSADRRQRELALKLQCALLSLDQRVRNAPEAPKGATDEEVLRRAAPYAQMLATDVRRVWSARQALRQKGTAGLFGVPPWLGPRSATVASGDRTPGSSAGLRLLEERLSSEDRVWAQVRTCLSAEPAGKLLASLTSDWTGATAPTRTTAATGGPVRTVRQPEEGGEPGSATGSRPTRIEMLFPVIHMASSNSFLVELTLHAVDQPEEPSGTESQALTPKFKSGLSAGRQAGLKLAARLGVPARDLRMWETGGFTFRGIPTSYRLDDTSASVGTAVAVVRHLLDLPDPVTLVSGEVNGDGVVMSLPSPADFTVKSRAAGDHGLGLLPLVPQRALSDVCENVWPKSWAFAVERTARSGLLDLSHEARLVGKVSTDVTATGQSFSLVRLKMVDEILQRMNAGASAVVVGGPRASARTTSVQQAALEWSGANGAAVVELRLKDGALPDRADLTHTIELARHATQTPMGSPTVVVLEDLLPYDDATDLDAVLPQAAEATGTRIIAICLYTGGTRWATNSVATVPSIPRTGEMSAFSEEFIRLNGIRLDAGRLAVARHAANDDFWWLVHLLMDRAPLPDGAGAQDALALASTATDTRPREEAEDAPFPYPTGRRPAAELDPSAAIRAAYVRRARGQVSQAQLDRIKAVAASSLLRVGVPDSLLTGLSPSALHRAGAQRDRSGRWYIERSATCRALLASNEAIADSTGREWMRTADAQYMALATLLRPYLRSYDRKAVGFVTTLLVSAKTVEAGLHRRLLELVSPMLTGHIHVDAPPVLVAHALLAGGDTFRSEQRQQLFETLVRSIYVTGWGGMTARQATTCLRAIRSNEDHAVGQIVPLHGEVIERIGRDMRPVLSRGDPAQGMLLVHELGRRFDRRTADEVVPLAVQATSSCNPGLVEHYGAAMGLLDAADKYGNDLRSTIREKFARSPGVRRLVEAEHRNDAGLILARVALELALTGDSESGALKKLGAALPASTPYSVAQGLLLIERIDLGWGRKFLPDSKFTSWFRKVVLDSGNSDVTPWQLAQLIRTLGKIDPGALMEALYSPDGSTAETSVIDAIVVCVLDMGDLKGVGQVVAAVTSFDIQWGPGGSDNAASLLCARFEQFVDDALDTERRGSVVLAVVNALVEANVSTATLNALLERCADVVEMEAKDSDKEYAPRLALLIGQLDSVGTEFLSKIDSRLDDDLLLKRMTRTRSVESSAAYMDLARALRRTQDMEFLETFLEDEWLTYSLKALSDGSVLSALKALRAYSLFLRDACVTLEEEGLLKSVSDDTKVWAKRLKKLFHPSQLSEALHLLNRLAPAMSVLILRELDVLYRPGASVGAALPALPAAQPAAAAPAGKPIPAPARIALIEQRKKQQRDVTARQLPGMLRHVQRQFINPVQAIELINAARTIDEDAGRSIGTALSARGNWEKKAKILRDMDAPVHLGNLLRMMAEADLALPPNVLEKLFRAWQHRAYRHRSPAVAGSIICGFAASGPQGEEMARLWALALNIDAFARRLERGLPHDIESAPRLVQALDLWGPDGSAERIAHALPQDAVARVGTDVAVNLLLTLEETFPDAALPHLEAAQKVIAERSRLRYVPNPEEHWHQLGWLIRITRPGPGTWTDASDLIYEEVAAKCSRPEIVAWVRSCLRRLPDDESWTLPGEKMAIWAECARLLAHSELSPGASPHHGRCGELLRAASTRWQIQLLHRARQDAELRRGLTDDDLDRLDEEGEDLIMVGRPVGAILKRAVEEVRATSLSL